MDANEIYVAVGGVLGTVATGFFSYIKGAKKRKIEEESLIIASYKDALMDIRTECGKTKMELQSQIDNLKTDIHNMKEHLCYRASCERREK